MFKGTKIYIAFLAICFLGLLVIQIYMPIPVNWSKSYTKNDKIPFGNAALYKLLPSIFPGKSIIDTKKPAYNTLKDNDSVGQNMVIINDVFNPDTLDIRELLQFAERGNNLFIAANSFSKKLMDTLKLSINNNFYDYVKYEKGDTLKGANFFKNYDSVQVHFTNPALNDSVHYIYKKGLEYTFLSRFDTVLSTVLSRADNGKVNFIKTKFGKGNIFINTLPEAFCNYYLVSSNSTYVFKALSYLPAQNVLWDEYYKSGNVRSDSPLRVIFESPMLLKAYYLTILSLILFIIIGAKRKQRIIPVIEPYKNSTLEFVGVVGTLYYQTGNHKNIVEKKTSFFLEFIRSSFRINTNVYNDDFIQKISNLSGVDKEKVRELFYYFEEVNFKASVSEQELLKLNSMIEDFHRESKR